MIRTLKPAAPLRGLVRHYVHVDYHLPDRTLIQPVPARSAAAIDFTFDNPYEVELSAFDSERAHAIAVIGPQTYRRVRLGMRGRIDNFVIDFEPSGWFRLFPLPPCTLTNRHFDAVGALGRGIAALANRLGECSTFAERANLVNVFLLRECRTVAAPTAVGAAAEELVASDGRERISALAARTGLCLRQFERRFSAEIGVAPKLFARIVRFEAALRKRAELPRARWTDIAQELGYHDQMHMVRDFDAFAGLTPSASAPLGMFVTPGPLTADSDCGRSQVREPVGHDRGAHAAQLEGNVDALEEHQAEYRREMNATPRP